MSVTNDSEQSPGSYDTHQMANVASAVRDLRHPKQIGKYTILNVIGEGGMGTVYQAQQREPINRTVAIKIIKLGMDTAEVIARFESERQALALMNHSNVAKVLDAGATESGRPYFVMEYFKGEPITTYADRHKLTLKQRLELFTQACDAVQHAHHKAIIHRDLKPSNILVTEEEGKPVVKVIDFGVAKALSHRLTERTLFTTTGQLVGTPEYMAPEQAESNLPDVDTRTDVYSLGVVLYELLIGALPFDAQTLRSAGYNEIQRIIREVDPPRPSTRLTRLGDAGAAEVARRRSVELDSLTKQLKSELEWIPLKAMRKERAARYASPTELAEDVQNYLHDRPLRAGPESATYRARKFLRRNKSGVAASAAMLLLLIAGIITTTWQAIRANREKRVAQYQEQQAVVAKENMRQVNRFLTEDLLASASPNVTRGRELTVREAVDRADSAVPDRFKGQPLTEAAVRLALAETYDALGVGDRALANAEVARDLRLRASGHDDPDTLLATVMVARCFGKLNQYPESERIARDALTRAQRLLPEDHDVVLDAMRALAQAIRLQNRFDEAEKIYRRSLELERRRFGDQSEQVSYALNSLGVLLNTQNRPNEAEPLYLEALAIRERVLGKDHPSYLSTLNNLARVYENQGKFAEAEAMLRQVLAEKRRVLKEEHPSTMAALHDLAAHLVERGRVSEAEPLYAELVERRTRVLGPDDVETLLSSHNYGRVLELVGRPAEAEQLLTRVLELRRRVLGETHTSTLITMASLARVHFQLQHWKEGDELIAYLIRPDVFPKLPPPSKASARFRHGMRLMQKQSYADAERELLEAWQIVKELKHPPSQREVANGLISLYEAMNRPAEVEKYRAEVKSLPSTQATK